MSSFRVVSYTSRFLRSSPIVPRTILRYATSSDEEANRSQQPSGSSTAIPQSKAGSPESRYPLQDRPGPQPPPERPFNPVDPFGFAVAKGDGSILREGRYAATQGEGLDYSLRSLLTSMKDAVQVFFTSASIFGEKPTLSCSHRSLIIIF